MADKDTSGNEVFAHSTMNRVSNSDELDRYIKVTNPSAWVVTLAALLLVGSIIVWALFAVVPVTVETTGVTVENEDATQQVVVCWVDKTTADRINKSGVKASINGVPAKDAKLDDIPMSASEVLSYLGSDFYADSIKLEDWNYLIYLEPGEELQFSDFALDTTTGEGHLVPVSIVATETQPINIVLGK